MAWALLRHWWSQLKNFHDSEEILQRSISLDVPVEPSSITDKFPWQISSPLFFLSILELITSETSSDYKSKFLNIS